MNKPDITIRIADWDTEQDALRGIRETVFIQEQAVRPEEEWEGDDHLYTHILAFDQNNKAIGTVRVSITPDYAKIGRMAVLKEYRGHHIGAALLEFAIDFARRQGAKKAVLNAQTSVKNFYARSGFSEEGKIFMEANIEHIKMSRPL